MSDYYVEMDILCSEMKKCKDKFAEIKKEVLAPVLTETKADYNAAYVLFKSQHQKEYQELTKIKNCEIKPYTEAQIKQSFARFLVDFHQIPYEA